MKTWKSIQEDQYTLIEQSPYFNNSFKMVSESDKCILSKMFSVASMADVFFPEMSKVYIII